MMALLRHALCALLFLLAWPLHAQQAITNHAPLQFRDAAEEQRFHALAGELRCVMCQNQSLADSNATIAVDLRHEVLDLMHQGKTDREIKDFLVQRYGDFVLYRPTLQGANWLLWLAPGLLALGAGAWLWWSLRRRGALKAQPTAPHDDTQEW